MSHRDSSELHGVLSLVVVSTYAAYSGCQLAPLLSFIRASILCIQNDDVPVGPTTLGGMAVVLRLSGIKTGWFVGNMRIVATRARLIKKGEHLPSFPSSPRSFTIVLQSFKAKPPGSSSLARPPLCIQNVDVPVGPSTERGWAVILRPSGIKAGWFVGSMRFLLCR